jgi:transposase-like protein
LSRRKGDTAAARLKRQQLVCRYFLRGLTVPEVARQLGVTERVAIERLTFEEQLARRVEKLKNDEGLRRSEGLDW